VPLTKIDTEEVKAVCSEYKIHNCDIIFREDCTIDQLIDVIEGNRCGPHPLHRGCNWKEPLINAPLDQRTFVDGHRIYIPCIYCLNKIDQISIEVRRASQDEDQNIARVGTHRCSPPSN